MDDVAGFCETGKGFPSGGEPDVDFPEDAEASAGFPEGAEAIVGSDLSTGAGMDVGFSMG